MSDANPHDEPADEVAVVVDDMDEFIERARYQQLFDARHVAAEAVREGPVSRLEGRSNGGSEDQVSRVVAERTRSAVASYVLEAEPLYQNTEIGNDLWQNASLGPAPFDEVVPAVPWNQVEEYDVVRLPADVTLEGEPPNKMEVSGIGAFLKLSGTYLQVKRSGSTDWAGRPQQDASETYELLTPPKVSIQAFRLTNHLLAELGVGLQAETDDENEARTDYSDVVDSGFEE